MGGQVVGARNRGTVVPGRQARARSRSSSSSQQQRGADNSVGTARPHTTPYAPECVNDGGREEGGGCAEGRVCVGERVQRREGCVATWCRTEVWVQGGREQCASLSIQSMYWSAKAMHRTRPAAVQ